jgi:uncharacterized cupredoxin-like copper-binding protein
VHVRQRSLLALGVAATVALGATACGGDDESTQATTSTRETTQEKTSGGAAKTEAAGAGKPTTVKVSETEYKIEPANPEIAKPGTVRFAITNDGSQVHSIEVEGPKGEKQSGVLQPGQKGTLQVDLSKPGSYEWYCPIANHKQLGMEGEIVVKG